MGTWNSRGLRGSTLEELINITIEKYIDSGIALIQKIPTPIKPINIDSNSRHITLAYFTPSGFGDEAKARLEAAVNEINLDSQFEIILDTKKLHYQHFFSMNDYRNILDFE